jgi:hypothetical protein
MDSNKDREKIAKQIAKTSDTIRKKYRALKTGKMEEDIALERHFRPIIEPLKQIVENTVGDESKPAESEEFFSGEEEYAEPKRKRSNVLFNNSIMTSTPIKSALRQSQAVPTNFNKASQILQDSDLSQDHAPSVEDVFEVTNEPLVMSVRQQLQTSEGRKKLQIHYGPLGQKYMGAVLSGKKTVNVDNVYGVYFSDTGTMLGNKRIDLHKNDDIFIDGKRYKGTQGLYELIFMKIPNADIYTSDDVEKYKDIILTTNAHRRDHGEYNPVLGNKGHKYKNIISPMLAQEKVGRGIPNTVTLNDNKIAYVHWDDPNELVDRLRLLEASRQAGHNAHDNEILSIIEELREAGLIIN